MGIKFPDLNNEIVFLVFGFTSDGIVCVGSFTDSKEAYYFAADQVGGIVVPGNKVKHLRSKLESSESSEL
ncbi:hypothetical protein LCGC14_1116960 [marine sediment metagenome]|uniref:Uncharacterized protein n=1 Tax=marine sediment metagenome TaxID=412755 RepID=A0A0F9M9W8_9ZZZZ